MEKVMVSDVPYMLEQWDAEKNTEIPAQVSAKNKTIKYHWRCKKCGYEWAAAPNTRFRAKGKCPCCESNKVIRRGVNDVLTVVPELAEMYDFEKNKDIDIYSQGIDSGVKVYWKCDECGRSWATLIKARIKKVNGKYMAVKCPHYNTTKRKSEEVEKVSEISELMRFWDSNRNTLDPAMTPSNSIQIAAWHCEKCGYEWESAINQRMKTTHKCPCCELDIVIRKGVNDICTLVPEAKKSYAFDKNEGIDIYRIATRSAVPLWWRCERCGYEWRTSIAARIGGERGAYTWRGCQQCYFNDIKRITPVSSIPKLMRFWDTEKNFALGLDANTTSAHSHTKAYWECQDCGYQWNGSIKGRTGAPDMCPHCECGRGVIPGENDVLTMVPELAAIYDFKQNTEVDISILSVSSKRVASFRCQKCGYRWESSIANRVKKNEDGGYRVVGCPQCDNNARRKMTYAEQYPELSLLFNEELNGCSLASVQSKDSNTVKYWWDCDKCGRQFQSRLQSMIVARETSTKGCPYCSNTKLIEGQSFADLHPELMDEYSPENTIDAFGAFPNYKGIVKWICRNDPTHLWETSFAARHKGGGSCPVCDGSRVVKGLNAFADVHKEYVSMWSPNNPRKPDETLYNSSLWFQWICPTCNGEYGAYIEDVVSEEESCPYCSNKIALPGFNSFAALYPKIAELWSPNNEKTADEVLPNRRHPAKWVCPDCNGEYSALINEMVSGKATCPYCEDRKVLPEFNSLAAVRPEVAKMWSPNNERSADSVLYCSRRFAKWVCTDCSGEYNALISDVVAGEVDCPYCSDRRVLPGVNSLAAIRPEVAKRWSPANEKNADEVLPNVKSPAKWLCPDCGGEYNALVNEVVAGEADCPYCSDRRVLPGVNSLAATRPEVAKQWSPANEKTADEVLPNVKSPAKWLCPDCGGEYNALVNEVVAGEVDCPYCNDRRVLPGFNSLAARHGDLMEQWNFLNNYLIVDPDAVGEGCIVPVWWNCPNNSSHKYTMSPAHRLMFQKRNREPCPYCKGLRRKKRHFI